jgi:hypothetical protein
MTEPKYPKLVKTANGWPGVYNTLHTNPKAEYPWRFHCPQPLCFMVLHAATEAILNDRVEKHQCPWFGGGTTTFSWGVMADDYLMPIWKMLDAAVDVMKSEAATPEEKTAARFGGRGLAEALAILMPPFFTTGDEIVKEALVRWENRQSGTDYETPGIGRFKWKRPPGVIGDPNKPSWAKEYDPSEPKKKAAPKHSLDDKAIAAIKQAAAFPAEILSTAYGVPVDVIKYIQEN